MFLKRQQHLFTCSLTAGLAAAARTATRRDGLSWRQLQAQQQQQHQQAAHQHQAQQQVPTVAASAAVSRERSGGGGGFLMWNGWVL